MLSSSCLVSCPGPRNPLWLFMAAYASLGLRLTKFDFNAGSSGMHRCCRLSGVGRAASSLGIRVTWGRRGLGREDAIIRGLIFVPIFTKFLTQMHRDALSANPAAASETSRDEHGVGSRFLFAEGEHCRQPSHASSAPSRWPRWAPSPSRCSSCTAANHRRKHSPMCHGSWVLDFALLSFACARQARPNWTDLLQEGTTDLLQARR